MQRLSSLLIIFVALLTLAGPAAAQEPLRPQYTEPTWQAAYWNNINLSGAPVLWRSEWALDYDWGAGSPDARINSDGFSARWTRYVDLAAGLYRFTATADDGVRVWVDGQLVINDWSDHAPRTVQADRQMSAGEHVIMVEYYENMGGAVIRVSWALISPAIQNWRGEYYSNTSLAGTPALVRDDSQIDFNWGEGSPAPGVIGNDRFSVRWSRTVDLPYGLYRFLMTVDDGGRLWVNGHLVIDAWFDGAPRTFMGDLWVPGGPIPVCMEYYENAGIAVARLTWQRLDAPAPSEIIVDDTSPGFVKGGSATGWRVAYTGYGGSLTWTRNNDWKRPNYNWARWYPTLQPGYYEVLVYIPELYSTTKRAYYWVAHYHGFTLRIVDQSANGGRWVSLGTYYFGGAGEYVSLNDTTYEPYLSTLLAFDAVKWVPR